jgi:hypothetical protein
MVTNLFQPFEDDLSQQLRGNFQSSLGSSDADPFEDEELFCEDPQAPSSSILDEHKHMVIPRKLKAPSTKRKYFHLEDFYEDSHMKRNHFSFFVHEVVPYLLSSSPGIHSVLF